jgi:hypothetical protein
MPCNWPSCCTSAACYLSFLAEPAQAITTGMATETSLSVLVGETLMSSEDPEAPLRTLRGDQAGSAAD